VFAEVLIINQSSEKVKFDMDTLKILLTFETLTGVKVKDIINDSSDPETSMLIFVVEQDMIGRAIGRHGSNVQQLERAFNRKIKIVEFNPSLLQYIRNFIYPLKLKEAKQEGRNVILVGEDMKTKGKLIGRESKNLKKLRTYIKRLFDIDEIKVM